MGVFVGDFFRKVQLLLPTGPLSVCRFPESSGGNVRSRLRNRSRPQGIGLRAPWQSCYMRLLVIFGPPAVGKMTVGREIARRSDFRLFHNHTLIEPLLEVFEYGTPPFNRLLSEWRVRVVEEAAMSGIDLLFTFVWGLELQDDADELR